MSKVSPFPKPTVYTHFSWHSHIHVSLSAIHVYHFTVVVAAAVDVAVVFAAYLFHLSLKCIDICWALDVVCVWMVFLNCSQCVYLFCFKRFRCIAFLCHVFIHFIRVVVMLPATRSRFIKILRATSDFGIAGSFFSLLFKHEYTIYLIGSIKNHSFRKMHIL